MFPTEGALVFVNIMFLLMIMAGAALPVIGLYLFYRLVRALERIADRQSDR